MIEELSNITLLEATENYVRVYVELDKSMPVPSTRPFNGEHSFEIKIPQRYDECGRKVSFTDLVSPFLDDYFWNMRIQVGLEGPCLKKMYGFNEELDEELVDLVNHHVEYEEREAASEKAASKARRDEWIASKNEECERLYNMAAEAFYNLTPTEMRQVRKANNVVWKDGKWDKEQNAQE